MLWHFVRPHIRGFLRLPRGEVGCSAVSLYKELIAVMWLNSRPWWPIAIHPANHPPERVKNSDGMQNKVVRVLLHPSHPQLYKPCESLEVRNLFFPTAFKEVLATQIIFISSYFTFLIEDMRIPFSL